MPNRRSGLKGAFGRAASLLVALLAVFTLVASGASHQLLHADDREATATSMAQVAQALDITAPKGHALPLHGCAGHCGAHVAGETPAPVALPAPRLMVAAWRVDRGDGPTRHPTSGPDRPPRA